MMELRRQAPRLSFALLLAIGSIGSVLADSKGANYKLELVIDWSAELNPFDYPGRGAHTSSLIGLTHDKSFILFEDGATASSGLELVAENGRSGILKAQFEELKRKDRIGAVVESDGIKAVPGKFSTTFSTTQTHPLLSVITMLAPSPDWFTGVSAVQLHSKDGWVDVVKLPLWVWDAGTDSGDTYLAENADTQPRESTRLLSTQHFLNGDGLLKFGTISVERQPN